MQTKYTLLVFFLFTITLAFSQKKNYSTKTIDKAREIQDRIITIDTHDDISVKNFTTEKNYTMNLDTQVNLPKMEEGGLDVAWFIVYTGQSSLDEDGYEKAHKNAMAKFEAIHRLVEEYAPDKIALALTSDDVKRIHGQGKKVAMIGIENGYPIDPRGGYAVFFDINDSAYLKLQKVSGNSGYTNKTRISSPRIGLLLCKIKEAFYLLYHLLCKNENGG